MQTLLWRGLEVPLMELARVEVVGIVVRASGTQLGVRYELRYELEPDLLRVELVGERRLEVPLHGLDFFDLGNSPLFNSLPVLRDGLLAGGGAHDYVMRWVSVPDLEIHESQQRYEPLGDGIVRFTSGSFLADIQFDEGGFVVRYPQLARRLPPDEDGVPRDVVVFSMFRDGFASSPASSTLVHAFDASGERLL